MVLVLAAVVVAVVVVLPGFSLLWGLLFACARAILVVVGLGLLSWFLLFLLLSLLLFLLWLVRFLAWVCVRFGARFGRFPAGFVCVRSALLLLRLPSPVALLLLSLVPVRSASSGVLAVGFGFLFRASRPGLWWFCCVPGLCVLVGFVFGFLVLLRLLLLLFLLWLRRVCALSPACCVGCARLAFPVLAPRPLRLCLRLRLLVRLFLFPAVGSRLVVLVAWMRSFVVLFPALVPCWFFPLLRPGLLLLLVRLALLSCVLRLAFALLLLAAVVCWWFCPPVLVRLACAPVARFVVVALGRGVRLLLPLGLVGGLWFGCLPVLFPLPGPVFPGPAWAGVGGCAFPAPLLRCSCLCSSGFAAASAAFFMAIHRNSKRINFPSRLSSRVFY